MNTQLLQQPQLIVGRSSEKTYGVFPATRYQGSKNKLIDWIQYHTRGLQFDSVLDAFGGTGSVAYMFKQQGKEVVYNDVLKFNYYIGLALIENKKVTLSEEDVEFILRENSIVSYPSFIEKTFRDIYYTDAENHWLDVAVTNIETISDIYKKALAYYALFQACIAKRPYNLFHRKNLYIRLAEVKRSFGNKATWDTPFPVHFRRFVELANRAVFDNGRQCVSSCVDALSLQLPQQPDVVYIDTPYISQKGVGLNYFDFYHFLEGMTDYELWSDRIDYSSKHRRLLNGHDQWSNKETIRAAFMQLFEKYKDSTLVVSYRDDGIPSIPELTQMLKRIGREVTIQRTGYKYVLSNGDSREVLLIAH